MGTPPHATRHVERIKLIMWRKCDPLSCACQSQTAELKWGVVGEKNRVRVAKDSFEAYILEDDFLESDDDPLSV